MTEHGNAKPGEKVEDLNLGQKAQLRKRQNYEIHQGGEFVAVFHDEQIARKCVDFLNGENTS